MTWSCVVASDPDRFFALGACKALYTSYFETFNCLFSMLPQNIRRRSSYTVAPWTYWSFLGFWWPNQCRPWYTLLEFLSLISAATEELPGSSLVLHYTPSLRLSEAYYKGDMPSVIQSWKLPLGSDILIIYLAVEEQRMSAKDIKLAKVQEQQEATLPPNGKSGGTWGYTRTLDCPARRGEWSRWRGVACQQR